MNIFYARRSTLVRAVPLPFIRVITRNTIIWLHPPAENIASLRNVHASHRVAGRGKGGNQEDEKQTNGCVHTQAGV